MVAGDTIIPQKCRQAGWGRAGTHAGAAPLDRFVSITMPSCSRGILGRGRQRPGRRIGRSSARSSPFASNIPGATRTLAARASTRDAFTQRGWAGGGGGALRLRAVVSSRLAGTNRLRAAGRGVPAPACSAAACCRVSVMRKRAPDSPWRRPSPRPPRHHRAVRPVPAAGKTTAHQHHLGGLRWRAAGDIFRLDEEVLTDNTARRVDGRSSAGASGMCSRTARLFTHMNVAGKNLRYGRGKRFARPHHKDQRLRGGRGAPRARAPHGSGGPREALGGARRQPRRRLGRRDCSRSPPPAAAR